VEKIAGGQLGEELNQAERIEQETSGVKLLRNSIFQPGQHELFVARLEEQPEAGVVGYLLLRSNSISGHICALAVSSRYRRLGIAEKMVRTVLNGLKEKNKMECSLSVNTKNSIAISLYRKVGFEGSTSVKENFYSAGEHAYSMCQYTLKTETTETASAAEPGT
jgi:ribosomal-protein-alanine N-acetyltransferase